MVRWSKAPRCWDEFKCNIWVNSWFRPPTECLGRERYFFVPQKKGMFLWKDDGQGNLWFREVVFFWWMELFIWIFPFFLGQKVQHLSRPCWSKQRSTASTPTPQRLVRGTRRFWEELLFCHLFSCSLQLRSCYGPCLWRLRREYATSVDQGTLLKCGMGNHEVGTVPGIIYLMGGRAWTEMDKATPKKRLGLNEHDGLQLCRCPSKGIIIKNN